ncbi:FAD:protein FMN transferase [Nitrosococcus watsonii]|uniref:FAD:protein FMN transferase n=1 Tax=Nitrosococcus watsoni (strain C-113) TaxID=105559 RepID=D8KBC6_NITWC|nr:FAD:protein FMN transferase [Nitrosococcus watsonii]ADJ29573.1 ApbE family lipoprotein [Nitrosococcus watsonii C-113]
MILRLFSLVGILLCLVVTACTESAEEDRLTWLSGATMGTGYSVKITDLPAGIDPKILDRNIARLLEEINGLMSTYQADSELSRFNRNKRTDWISVSAEIVKVLEEAQGISRLSKGALDVTVGPLVNLWGFGPGFYTNEVPSRREMEAEKERVGFKQLQIRHSPPAVRKKRGDIYVDLSAIAKGYGVDRIAEFLEAQGIYNYLVDIGGEERIKGHGPKGTPWRIAIERPVAGERRVQRILELDSGAVATSGNYRNYFEQDGKRYSHTLDPRTGWPITHQLASVTVVNATAMRADALATALLVLGPEQGLRLAEQEQIAALFIIKTPEGFRERATRSFTKIRSWDLLEKESF